MKDQEFADLVQDPAARAAAYQSLVRAYYDRVSPLYRRAWGDSYHFALFDPGQSRAQAVAATERMIAAVGAFRPGMRVLDVGCGIGGPALTIARHSGAHVTGIDLVEQHVETARQRAAAQGLTEQTRFEVADAMSLPFADGAFDHVYVFESGCHTPDKARFVRECARVLRCGGAFLGLDWLAHEGLSPEESARYIEPICRHFAIPALITLPAFRRHLTDAGLHVQVLSDALARSDVGQRAPLTREAITALCTATPSSALPNERLLADGVLAVTDAARAGAFVLGYWRAVKLHKGESVASGAA